MRIAWLSNPAWGVSGYSVQTNLFVRRLMRLGHQVAVVSNVGNQDGPAIRVDGIYHFPAGPYTWPGDGFHFGWRGLVKVAESWKPDLCFSLFDIWTFKPDLGKILDDLGAPWCPICPVDHDPISPAVLDRLKGARFPIAMTKFGQEKMLEGGVERAWYIPHGVDTTIYRPYPRDEKVRKIMGGNPDNFIVGCVAANAATYDRKGFEHLFRSYAIFHEKHKDTSLYLHTNPTQVGGGLDLTTMAKRFGVEFSFPDLFQSIEGFSDENMALIYANMDVHFLTSRGEGFGIPLIQAQACGTPVIHTNFAGGAELVGSGWKVAPLDLALTDQGSFQAIPDTDENVEALELAYRAWKRGRMDTLKEKARKFALNYDIDRVFGSYMIPFLVEAMEEKAAWQSEKQTS